MLLVYLVFATHVLLDSFTVPTARRFSGPSVTRRCPGRRFSSSIRYIHVPLLVGVITALVMSREHNRGHLANRIGLVVSSLYLAWTVPASFAAEHNFKSALQAQNIEYDRIHTSPAPFNSLTLASGGHG